MTKEKQTDDGGAAFPDPCGAHLGAFPPDCDKGMTLRDYFAAAALTGLIGDTFKSAAGNKADPSETKTNLVNACYKFADAMLQARKEAHE